MLYRVNGRGLGEAKASRSRTELGRVLSPAVLGRLPVPKDDFRGNSPWLDARELNPPPLTSGKGNWLGGTVRLPDGVCAGVKLEMLPGGESGDMGVPKPILRGVTGGDASAPPLERDLEEWVRE